MNTTAKLLRDVLIFLFRMGDSMGHLFELVLEKLNNLGQSNMRIEHRQRQAQEQLDRMEAKLDRIIDAVIEQPALAILFDLVHEDGTIEEGVTSFKMRNDQTQTARIRPVGSGGKPAGLDGVPVWASADETIATVTAAADGLSAVISPTGPTGTVRITASGDGDLGEGVRPIFGFADVDVTPGNATGIEMTLDTPVDVPTGGGGSPTP